MKNKIKMTKKII